MEIPIKPSAKTTHVALLGFAMEIIPHMLMLWLLTATAAWGQLHIAFHNGTTTGNAMTTRPSGSVVNTGAVTWNNVINTGGLGLSFSAMVLKDTAGADSGARLAVSATSSTFNNNGWGTNTQDWVMMEGWYGLNGGNSITVSNLPAAYTSGFSVIIYGDSNTSPRTMNYRIGAQTKTLLDSGAFNGTFTEGTNRATFSGLTGNSFTLTGNSLSSDPLSAVNGIVIIPVAPSPSPVIQSFATNDAYVTPGVSVTLTWSVTGATSLQISPSIGIVTGNSIVTSVSTTTTFTLTAINAAGQSSATVRVGAGPPRPNMIFFLVDDMGWQDTSEPFHYDSSGNPIVTPLNQRYRTPNMQLLAARGMKFTNAYSMPVCTPSRTCWITGMNSARHRVTNWTNVSGTDNDENSTTTHNSPTSWTKGGLPSTFTTLPSLLQSAGYRTIHVGKAHFGATPYAKQPLNIGFDVNVAGSEIGHPASYFANDNFGTGSNRVTGLDSYHGSGLFLTEVLTREMNLKIEQAVADDAPFFAYMAHYAVHSPFQADPRFSANYPGLSGNELAFATLIEGMDKSLGDLLVKLDQLGVAENTLIVFMSDNGGDAPFASVNSSNAPLRHKKGSKYEGGVREPCIVSWAKRNSANPFQAALPIPAGSREDDIVAIFDLFPTFAAVGGVSVPSPIDGHDLTPYLRATPGTHRPQELLIHYPHDHRSDYFTIFRENEWKLIYNYPTNSYELYNLALDISETTDRSSSEPERVMRMARKMALRLADAGAQWPTFASGGGADPCAMPALPAVDLDADGIPDNLEDPNSNGLIDAGETNPDNDNTDGDPTRDGDELRTGTNPLDGASFFRVLPSKVGGHFLLTWPSKAGAIYRIESSTDLQTGPWTVVADNVIATAGSTSYDAGAIPAGGRLFYRIVLK